MIARLLRTGLLVVVWSAGAAVHADEPPLPNGLLPLRQALFEAIRDDDDARMAAIARDPPDDPLQVAHEALVLALAQPAAAGIDPPAFAKALARFAGYTKDRPEFAGVVRFALALTKHDAAAWRRERRLIEASGQLRALMTAGDPTASLERAAASEADRIAAPTSVAAWRILRFRGFAKAAGGDIAGALADQQAAADQAASQAWPHLTIYALDSAARHAEAQKQQALRTALCLRAWDTALRTRNDAHIAMRGWLYGRCLQDEYAYAEAERIHRRALAAAERQPDRHLELLVRQFLYYVCSRQGKGQAALDEAQAHLARAKQLGDGLRIQEGRQIVGTALLELGRYAESIEHLESVVRDAVPGRAPWTVFTAMRDLGVAWVTLGDAERSAAWARKALALAEANGWSAQAAGSRRYLARALLASGRLAEAEQQATLARAAYDPASQPEDLGMLEVVLALIQQRRGAVSEARTRLERAEALFDRAGSQAWGEATRVLRLTLEAEHGDREAAYRELGALRASLAHVDPLRIRVDMELARWGHALGHDAAAMQAARASLQAQLRSLEGLSAPSAIPSQGRLWEAAQHGVQAAARLAAAKDADGAALAAAAHWMIEASRATQLLTALRRGNQRQDLPPHIRLVESSSRLRLRQAHRRVVAAARGSDAERAAAGFELSEAWRDRDDIVRRVQRASRRAALLLRADPIPLSRVQAGLATDEAWIGWFVGATRVLALVARDDHVALVDLGPHRDVADAVERWRLRLATPGAPEQALASALYAQLFAPLRGRLEGVRSLHLCPDPVLSALPFGALLDPDAARPTRLIERYEITLSPSATVSDALAADLAHGKPGRGLLAIANPHAEPLLPRLPHAEQEVRALARHFAETERTVLVGADATLDALAAPLARLAPPWRAIHFACHGVYDAEDPSKSGLVLAGPETWHLDQILATPIRSDLVVLSACDTARGQAAVGEGLLGLARGFLWAGSRRVIASAWRVEDEATATLMAGFYGAWLAQGQTVAAALRSAQRAALATGGAGAEVHRWAAFVLWGPP